MSPQLDPDEVTCPTCNADPGAVCTTPTGARSKTVHAARRRAAAAAPADERPASVAVRKPRGKGKPPPATRESRAKGARAANEAKRARIAEVRELVGEIRARAIVERAETLAANAVRFDQDRMLVKRLALDATIVAGATFVEALEGYRRLRLDEEGRPIVVSVETDEVDHDGRRKPPRRQLDTRGAFSPDDVKALAVAWGVSLDKLRLEEGSSTSRSEHVFEPGALSKMDTAQLVELAGRADTALRELGIEDA